MQKFLLSVFDIEKCQCFNEPCEIILMKMKKFLNYLFAYLLFAKLPNISIKTAHSSEYANGTKFKSRGVGVGSAKVLICLYVVSFRAF